MAQRGSRLGGVVILWLFGSLFLLGGLIALGVSVSLMFRGIRAEHWPVTTGTILSAKISRRESSDEHGTHTTYSPEITYSFQVGNRKTHSPEVAYNYQVGQSDFIGNKIAFGQMSSSMRYAQGVLDRYPVGKKIPVHYSPDNPSEAVLETGIHGGAWITLVVGVVFSLCGGGFLFMLATANKATPANGLTQSAQPVGQVGRSSANKAPVFIALIFVVVGAFIALYPADTGDTPHWVIGAAGGMFGLAGIGMLLDRLENKLYSKTANMSAGLILLAIFHWLSFAPGERIGTRQAFFFIREGVNVKTGFALVTSFFDLILLLAIVSGLRKWWKARG